LSLQSLLPFSERFLFVAARCRHVSKTLICSTGAGDWLRPEVVAWSRDVMQGHVTDVTGDYLFGHSVVRTSQNEVWMLAQHARYS